MIISSCTRTLLGPVRPVRPTGQTGWSCQTNHIHVDRSDRLNIPVRPVLANFGHQHMPPCSLAKFACQRTLLLDQNCLRAMITNASAIFCAKGDKNYRPYFAFHQVDEIICFGLQTFFMAIGFVGWTSTCCSIFS